MKVQRAALLSLLLTTVALAGCFGDDGPAPVRSVTASGGEVSDGYAYDGQGIQQAGATLEGWMSAPEDRGSVNATFDLSGSSWTVAFDQFGGPEEFKEGGVVFDLREHGDTGVSSAAIPSIFAEVAAWGTAQVQRDGQPVVDPEGNTGRWSAHLMLSQTTVRGEDGLIAKSDGSTPYDPGTPADARTVEDDRQALLVLTAPSGPDSARAPLQVNETVQVQGPNASTSVPVEAAEGASATVNVSAHGGETGVAAAEVQVRIVANGTELASESGQVTPAEGFTASFALEDLPGPFTVEVSGAGAATVDVNAHVVFDDHPFVVLVWDDYAMEGHAAPP